MIVVAGVTVMVGNPMEAQDEDGMEDTDVLYNEHVEGETDFENESEEGVESYSEEELERKREEALEEYEDTMVKALGLDDGPNFEDEENVNEWFEELDEDELEELREYQLEQMPDSNGCGLTSYDGGPNEREEDDQIMIPPNPNGGGGGPGEVGDYDCPEDDSFDYKIQCISEHENSTGTPERYCDELCHGYEVECTGAHWNFYEQCVATDYDPEERVDKCDIDLDDAGLMPPSEAECVANVKSWGVETVCNEEATKWLDDDITGGSPYAEMTLGFTGIITGNVVLGIASLELGYLRSYADECTDNNEKLVISQTWALTHPILSCRG